MRMPIMVVVASPSWSPTTGEPSLPMNRLRPCGALVALTTIMLLAASATAAAPVAPTAPSAAALREARAWAAGRDGSVSWAVIDTAGRIHGSGARRRYPSASVTKALLLVAALRAVPGRPVPVELGRVLRPMIRRSGNRAAGIVHRRVGDAGLRAVGRAAGMRSLRTNGTWSEVELTAPDLARFFRRVDRLVPARHRAYARALLERIVARQSWGVPRAARPLGWRVLFKGGWRRRLVHQGALAEREGRRVALAVLSDGSPSHEYGRGTLEGIARRLLR